MTAYAISDAGSSHLDAILRLLSAAELPTAGVIDNLGGFLVANRAGRTIGSICMEEYGSDVLLRSLVVADEERLSGVASGLVRQFLDRARMRGGKRVFLLTTGAAGYFERFGFRELAAAELPEAVKQSKEFSGCCAAGATAMELDLDESPSSGALKEGVRQKYAAVANRAKAAAGSSCCGPKPAIVKTQVTRDIYDSGQTACLPTTATDGSRGCGNPTAISRLAPGEVVLDIGSGAGADVFLAATKVGPAGRVYGLDMTKEMIDLARNGQKELGLSNVEFILGEMERIPLPAASVDVVISNCVISLAQDKDQVLREIARVLKCPGRIVLSDIVSTGEVPAGIRDDLNAWLGCLGGALSMDRYREKLARAGFADVGIDVTRVYDLGALFAKEMKSQGADALQALHAVQSWEGQICAASVTATLPLPRALVVREAMFAK